MEHILSQCEVQVQGEAWALAKELWAKRNPDWPWPALRVSLGAPENVERSPRRRGRAPKDWMASSRFLVGVRPMRQQGEWVGAETVSVSAYSGIPHAVLERISRGY